MSVPLCNLHHAEVALGCFTHQMPGRRLSWPHLTCVTPTHPLQRPDGKGLQSGEKTCSRQTQAFDQGRIFHQWENKHLRLLLSGLRAFFLGLMPQHCPRTNHSKLHQEVHWDVPASPCSTQFRDKSSGCIFPGPMHLSPVLSPRQERTHSELEE